MSASENQIVACQPNEPVWVDMKGWSRSNLMYIRQFAEAWTRREIVQAPLGQLPWYHHLALLECLKSRGDRIAYAALAIENGWSRDSLLNWLSVRMTLLERSLGRPP